MAVLSKGTWKFNNVLTAPNTDLLAEMSYKIAGVQEGAAIIVSLEESDNSFALTYRYNTSDSYEFCAFASGGVSADREGITGWVSESHHDSFKYIVLTEEQEVSEDFYTWFTANTFYEGQKTVSGKWRINDYPDMPMASIKEVVNFDIRILKTSGLLYDGIAHFTDVQFYMSSGIIDGYLSEEFSSKLGATYLRLFYWDTDSSWHTDEYGPSIQVWDFGKEPQEVSYVFYKWLTENAKSPVATITHGDAVVAEMFHGQTAILKCADMKMTHDVFINMGDAPEPKLQDKTITSNGEYTLNRWSGYDGFGRVIVDVPTPIPEGYVHPLGTVEVTRNGSYDVTNFENVSVNVDVITPTGTKFVTENGTHDVAEYENVNVNVPQPSGKKTITENGTHDVADYAEVEVNVDVEPNLTSLEANISSNGSVTIPTPDGYDGLSSVKVNVNVNSAPKLAGLTADISKNGSSTISTPSGYDGISSVQVNVNVPTYTIIDSASELSSLTNLYDGMIAIVGG